jgi:hypothetical protein
MTDCVGGTKSRAASFDIFASASIAWTTNDCGNKISSIARSSNAETTCAVFILAVAVPLASSCDEDRFGNV